MQCPRCQAINDDGAVYCSRCGSPFSASAPAGSSLPQGGTGFTDYLVWAILVTIFCCVPLGIPAIIFASNARTKYSLGDYAGAQNASNTAKTFLWLAFGLGLCVWFIYMIYIVVVVIAAINS